MQAAPAIKWQYFLGADGGLGEYPAHRADAAAAGGLVDADVERRRDLFVQAVYPRPKQVVLVVDHGSALSPNQLRIAKAIGEAPTGDFDSFLSTLILLPICVSKIFFLSCFLQLAQRRQSILSSTSLFKLLTFITFMEFLLLASPKLPTCCCNA